MGSNPKRILYCGFNGFGQFGLNAETSGGGPCVPQDVCSAAPISLSSSGDGSQKEVEDILFLGWSRLVISNTDKRVLVKGFWNGVSGYDGTICDSSPGMQLGQVVCTEKMAVGINQNGELLKLPLSSISSSSSTSSSSSGVPTWEGVLTECDKPTRFVKVASSEHCIIALDDAGQIHIPPLKMDNVVPAAEFVDISCGKEHFMALTKDGTVYTWGSGSRGQLGNGSIESSDAPLEVPALGGVRIVRIACGGWHSAALSDSGDVYIWGWNESGQLGFPCRNLNRRIRDGGSSIVEEEDYVSIQSEPRLLDNAIPVERNVISVSCGARHTAVTLSDKSGWTWGWNGRGQLGTGDRLSRWTPGCVIRDVDTVMCGGWSTAWLSSSSSSSSSSSESK